MKNLITFFTITSIFLITNTFTIYSQTKSDSFSWNVSHIWEITYDTIKKENELLFSVDTDTEIHFIKINNYLSEIAIRTKNYGKCTYAKGDITEHKEHRLSYSIFITQSYEEEDSYIYFSHDGNDKFVIYKNGEGYIKDAWHFTNFNESLDLYTESKYFAYNETTD
tara:strand:+ start:868 stop:1365 length:498 start_codon:yes stop_codon:yes gene_type:complete